VDRDYLHVYDAAAPELGVRRVWGQPHLSSTLGTLTLFTSSGGHLYIGNVDLSAGFKLLTFDGSTCVDDDDDGNVLNGDDYVACDAFVTVSDDGFGNPRNAYAWSMAELDGHVFVGTFDLGLLDDGFPRGSAELWMSDAAEEHWQQVALPASFGPMNYGVRTMAAANRQLFLGTASNMVAPDLTVPGVTTFASPGTEVWSIRDGAILPPGDRR
jgi:hypothetical protein